MLRLYKEVFVGSASCCFLAFHCFSMISPDFRFFCACFASPRLSLLSIASLWLLLLFLLFSACLAFPCLSFAFHCFPVISCFSCFFCACLALPGFSPAFLYFPASCPVVAYCFPVLIAFAFCGLYISSCLPAFRAFYTFRAFLVCFLLYWLLCFVSP